MLVELTPDIHICGICKQQFNNLDAFVGHKQSGCQLTSATAGATSTVQFVSEETVPSTQAQSTSRAIASETQTITGTGTAQVHKQHRYRNLTGTETSQVHRQHRHTNITGTETSQIHKPSKVPKPHRYPNPTGTQPSQAPPCHLPGPALCPCVPMTQVKEEFSHQLSCNQGNEIVLCCLLGFVVTIVA